MKHAVLCPAWWLSALTFSCAVFSAVNVQGQPANNNFVNAWTLTGTSVSTNGSTSQPSNATEEPGEPDHAGFPGGRSVWFNWTAPADGMTRIDTLGSGFNTLLAVYIGRAVSALSPVISNDNVPGTPGGVSRVLFPATQGTTYRIAVDGRSGGGGGQNPASGAYVLNLQMLPSVEITTPTDGSVLLQDAPITISAEASSPNGPVTRVDFFHGNTGEIIAADTTEPYSIVFTNALPGTNLLVASVTDSAGQVVFSPLVQVAVVNIGVTITYPTDGFVFLGAEPIPLSATVLLPANSITNIEFFVNGQKFAEDATSPFGVTWNDVRSGVHRFTAIGKDDAGTSHTSAPVAIAVAHTLIALNSAWRYLDNGSDQRTVWTTPDFDDTGWASGPAELGYGDGDEATVVSFGPNQNDKHVTTYFRRSFVISDPAEFTDLLCSLIRDDAGIVHLNGQEVFRSENLPAPPSQITYQTLAIGQAAEDEVDAFIIPASNLRAGTNVLAVEIHQQLLNSSDISFNFEMIGLPAIPRNQSPVAAITSPANETSFLAPSSITIEAGVFDADGSVTNVEFFVDGIGLGATTNEPHHMVWNNPPLGVHILHIIAADDQGATTISPPVALTVYDALGTPLAQVVSPTNGMSVEGPIDIPIIARASAVGGVTNVEFYAGETLIGVSSGPEASGLKADYQFQGSLSSSVGTAPALANLGNNTFGNATVDGTSQTVLRFAQNDGVVLSRASSLIENNVYTLVVLFSFSDVSSWRRVIDFKNAATDNGFYVLNGGLNFYPFAFGSAEVIPANTFVQVVLTRDEAGSVAAYVDGVEQFTFIDTEGEAELGAGNALRFFRDNGTEGSAGAVARIRVYNVALPATEVAALDRLPDTGSVPTHSIIWSNAMFGTNILTAVALGADGARGTSAPVALIVRIPPPNTNAPIIAAQVPAAGATIGSLASIQVVFSERVVGVNAEDLRVNGLPATRVIGSGSNYTFTVIEPVAGTVQVTWQTNHGIEDIGLPILPFDANAPGGSWEYTLADQTPPVITAQDPLPFTILTNLTEITVDFSEAVAGVDAADLLINDTPAFALSGSGTTYTFNFSQPPSGFVNVAWATEHGIADLSSPSNSFDGASAGWFYILDARTILVESNSVWLFVKGTAEASTPIDAWRQLVFDDSRWTSSLAPFFYGDPYADSINPGTQLNDMQGAYSSIYLRRRFVVPNRSAVTNLFLRGQSDDGFIAWINGAEVLRYNVGDGDVAYNGGTLSPVQEPNNRGAAYIDYLLPDPAGYLVEGENVLAVHAFNQSLGGSSDFGFNAQLYTYLADPSVAAPRLFSVMPLAGDVFFLTNVTIRFTEPVTGVDAADLLINGTPALLASSTTNTTYTFHFAQPPYGNVSLSWATGHAIRDFDAPPKPFDGSAPGSVLQFRLLNPNAPTVSLRAPPAGSIVNDLNEITVTFSEPVSGVNAGDLLINGMPAAGLTGADATYTFTFPQPPYGDVVIDWTADHGIADFEQPPNAFETARPGSIWTYTLRDLRPPLVSTQTPPAGAALTNLTEIQVTFSEPVSGVTAGDLLVNGFPAASVTGDGVDYTFQFVQPNTPVVQITWAPLHGIADLAAVPNPFDAAAPGSSWQYDLIDVIAPTVMDVFPPAGAMVRTLTDVHVTFSEDVNGIDAGDLLMNGVPARQVNGSLRGPYEFEFRQPANGPVTLQWAASHGIHDFASPSNRFAGLASAGWTYTLDTNLPQARVVINEIMYHPSSESPADEFIELFNAGSRPVDLTGWSFGAGLSFRFPAWTLERNAYLVVAADVAAFINRYPGVTNVIGGWEGTLSNNGEEIEIQDAVGNPVDSVSYSDEGDWGVRQRGALDRGSRGWEWFAEHDGLNKSLELRNPNLDNSHGQNWAASLEANGTPGRVNSQHALDGPPLVLAVNHSPAVPRSTDSVAVTARIIDEEPGFMVRLLFRNHSMTAPPPFGSAPMFDDGQHGDGPAGDGVYGAIVPAQSDRTVVEFYVEAVDTTGLTNTWPAPAGQINLTTSQVGQTFAQNANALFQIDDGVYSGAHPIHRLIMTETERLEFENINRQSDAEMNCTLITIDGTDTKVRYLCGMRIRGAGSRGAQVPNYRVNIPHDAPWNGVDELNHNSRFGFNQVIGSALARKVGMAAANARLIQVRVNGANLASSGSPQYGNYALLEVFNADWSENHFPADGDGNLYRASTGNHSANFNYRGTNPQSYMNAGFLKASNSSENDWTDLILLTEALDTTPDETYAQAVRNVANVEQWMRYFAFFSMTVSRETSLGDGRGDDYALYRGLIDPRFILLAHDLDTILGQGDTPGLTNTPLFRMIVQAPGHTAPNVAQLVRFMRHPEFVPLYYSELKRLAEGAFSPAQINPLLDQLLGNDVPTVVLENMKLFARNRASWVLSQIPLQLTVAGAPPSGDFLTSTDGTIALSGRANVIETRSIFVSGTPANWIAADGLWSITGLPVSPGLNRLLVQAFDQNGAEIDRTTIDVLYDDGTTAVVAGTLPGDAIWSPGGGPYLVSNNVTVLAGDTLTIQPGTTVYFGQDASLIINGGLLAEGTDSQRIRLTRAPGTTDTWNGIRFADNAEGRIAYADIEFAAAGDPITALNSVISIDHVTFNNTSRTVIDLNDSSALIRNSIFPTITDNETIHGNGMPAGGYVIIESNYFGGTTGYSDIIAFTGGRRPGPILQVLNNTFHGGSDDALDLDGTDAHIEGNVFRHIHQDAFRDSGSFAIATDMGSELTVVRNVFFDNDHALLLKNGASAVFHHNTVVGIRTNAASVAEAAVIAFGEPNRGAGGAAGADIDGNIFWDVDSYRHFLFFTNGLMSLNVSRSILSGTNHPGVGNLSSDPAFFDAANADFRLVFASPARATGPNGLDMGALVPAGASVSGEPPAVTPLTSATLLVAGPGITHYRYRVNEGDYSSEFSATTPISLNNLTNGSYTVFVIGKNSAGVEQNQPSVSRSWMVNTVLSRLVINEVLARNVTALNHFGEYPDLVELFNAGGTMMNLAGMRLTDDRADPNKFVFPSGTTLAPGEYLLLYADSENTPGLHLGFGLGADGDELLLFDKPSSGGALLDSVSWGPQLADLSIGRLSRSDATPTGQKASGPAGLGEWRLTRPTPGLANIAAALGDPLELRINEWLTFGLSPFPDDFIELYNPDGRPVSLGGLFLSDEPVGLPQMHEIAPLSFIAAGGLTVFIADGDADEGPAHLNFRLAPEQGLIALSDHHLSFIDCVVYGPQRTDLSQGRSPNGGSNLAFFPSPTPGSPNPAPMTTNVTIVINEVFANNVSYAEADGATPDWVEVHNPTASLIDLGGMSLTDSLETPRRYVFADGSVLAPASYLVLRCQGDLPPSPTNTGFGLNRNGSGVYLFDKPANGASLVDSIVFGIQPPDFSIGRVPNGANDWVLNIPTRAGANIAAALADAAQLKVNEWLANPIPGADDWFEIHNPNPQPVALGGLHLTDNLSNRTKHRIPPLSFIGAGLAGFAQFQANNTPEAGADHVNFALSAGGESLGIATTNGVLIDSLTFGVQTEGISQGRLPDGAAAVVNFPLTPTPGDANYLPLMNVVINEVLTHSDSPLEDAIELHNISATAADLSGWYLSDTRNNLKKFRLPAGTELGAHGFQVYYENEFNPAPDDPLSFSLNSARGDEVWLSAADTNGALTGWRAMVRFGAAENGVAFGRHLTSVGADFVAMLQHTFGANEPATVEEFRTGEGLPNSQPRIGPVVVSEIMYRPPDVAGSDNTADEFIELHNLTEANLPLFDLANQTNTWRMRNAVDFEFPPGVFLEPNASLLVVSFDPIAAPQQLITFLDKYGVGAEVPIFGPYRGKLDNSSDAIELYKPDAPQLAPDPDAGHVPYVLVDRVHYSDHTPWPAGADGGGLSLHRLPVAAYGNEPTNWVAGSAAPGRQYEPNIAPVLNEISSQTISEWKPLVLEVTATDPNNSQSHTFSFGADAPTGAHITPAGRFSWRPTETQGPGDFEITVRVTDDGVPSLSDSKTFQVTVLEVNTPPIFLDTRRKYVNAGNSLAFATAADRDVPNQSVSFELLSGAPEGLTLDPATGVLSWTPPGTQSPGAYEIGVRATDDGEPPLNNTMTYVIEVAGPDVTVIVAEAAFAGSDVDLRWQTTSGKSYQLQSKQGANEAWQPSGNVILASGPMATVRLPMTGNAFFRVVQLD